MEFHPFWFALAVAGLVPKSCLSQYEPLSAENLLNGAKEVTPSSSEKDIADLQTCLRSLGYITDWNSEKDTGIFGSKTRNAVRKFRGDRSYAWGKPQEIIGRLKNTIGRDNPFRYRGYWWDEETGLCYLRNRHCAVTFSDMRVLFFIYHCTSCDRT